MDPGGTPHTRRYRKKVINLDGETVCFVSPNYYCNVLLKV